LSPPCVALRSPSPVVRNFLRNAGVLDHHNSAAKLLRVGGVFVVLHDLCNCEICVNFSCIACVCARSIVVFLAGWFGNNNSHNGSGDIL
jgi:hypothetical protein